MHRRTRLWAAVVLAFAGAAFVWRAELFTVSRPGDRPRPLQLIPAGKRTAVSFDVIVTAIPNGLHHLSSAAEPVLIHYWAPWERHSLVQAAALDSLSRSAEIGGLHAVLVCFDPFPSVARFVARHRLRITVLLDRERSLRAALPCPSVPYTYVIDAAGRIAVAQAGEVDWWADETRAALGSLLHEPAPRPGASGHRPAAISSRNTAP